MAIANNNSVTLRHGLEMPLIGIGTSHQGGFSHEAIMHAFKIGYRYIAQWYWEKMYINMFNLNVMEQACWHCSALWLRAIALESNSGVKAEPRGTLPHRQGPSWTSQTNSLNDVDVESLLIQGLAWELWQLPEVGDREFWAPGHQLPWFASAALARCKARWSRSLICYRVYSNWTGSFYRLKVPGGLWSCYLRETRCLLLEYQTFWKDTLTGSWSLLPSHHTLIK